MHLSPPPLSPPGYASECVRTSVCHQCVTFHARVCTLFQYVCADTRAYLELEASMCERPPDCISTFMRTYLS